MTAALKASQLERLRKANEVQPENMPVIPLTHEVSQPERSMSRSEVSSGERFAKVALGRSTKSRLASFGALTPTHAYRPDGFAVDVLTLRMLLVVYAGHLPRRAVGGVDDEHARILAR